MRVNAYTLDLEGYIFYLLSSTLCCQAEAAAMNKARKLT